MPPGTPGRPSPLLLLEESNRRRLPDLVPIRDARMRASPFAFLRGAPGVMARDLATTPVTGITVQACGDAHLLNFGLFATPERNLSFGLNDFDETLPAPWEWDVKRLAASLVVAARTVGLDQALGRRAAEAMVRTYREQMARYAGMRLLEVWYSRVDASTIVAMARGGAAGGGRAPGAGRAPHQPGRPAEADRAGRRRPALRGGPAAAHPRRGVPRGLGHRGAGPLPRDPVGRAAPAARPLPAQDAARKVVGVGSVGTRCYVVLLLGDRHDDPLLLQVKQAAASVLEPHAGRSRYRHPGHRVVNGQRLLQTASDIFLGWTGDGTPTTTSASSGT